MGEWFKRTGQRDKIFLASKFGFVKGSKTYETDTSAEYCKKACEASLKTLGTDYIDLCKASMLSYPFSSFQINEVLVADPFVTLFRLPSQPESEYAHRGDYASTQRASRVSGRYCQKYFAHADINAVLVRVKSGT